MSEKQDPTKPTSNDEKFKPQNVAGEGKGQPGTSGRPDRNMDDTARGSEPAQRGTSGHRG